MNGLRALMIQAAFGFHQAMLGVWANRLRSAITVLGVMVGVASVVSLVAIGDGARAAITRQFEAMGTNVIKIDGHHPAIRLTPDDVRDLVERVPTLQAAVPVVRADAQVKWRRTTREIGILGVSEQFPLVRDQAMLAGRFFSHLHVRERLRVAVVGAELAQALFEGRPPIGQRLYIGGHRFTIIGVLAPKGAGLADDIDRLLVVPVTAAQRLTMSFLIDEIWAKAASREAVEPAVVQIGRILRRRFDLEALEADGAGREPGLDGMPRDLYWGGYAHGVPVPAARVGMELPGGGGPALTVTSLNELVREADAANRIMTLMLGGIAGVSLLVGGLGIMNVMLVAVTERTTEIGLRKSLGATRLSLLYQFLMEAFLLSGGGAVLGLATGYAVIGVLDASGMEAMISLSGSLAALTAAIGVGLTFGGYPAYVAAGLAPAEALRRQ
ncbi:MAG TPA: cell division protein FtsX [Clostridiales bacterium]|nr:cell division protein FtsX [Clostridiales bacterium]